MPKITEALKAALPYLGDKEVRSQFEETLNDLHVDLEEVGYDETDEIVESARKLQEKLNEFDERSDKRKAELEELGQEAREEAEAEEENDIEIK